MMNVEETKNENKEEFVWFTNQIQNREMIDEEIILFYNFLVCVSIKIPDIYKIYEL